MSVWKGYKFDDTEQRRERFLKVITKHGLRYTPEYRCWIRMKQRCNNPKNLDYQYYGGRGIKVCEKWSNDFVAFYNDMGECPKGYEIDREDTNKGYSKDNCKWVPKIINSRNKRTSKYWFIDGVRYDSLTQASEAHNVGINSIKRWCEGRTGITRGKIYTYPPKHNCWSEFKYER